LLFFKKKGQKTDGKDYFYNGVAGKSEQGLKIFVISVVEIETRLSYSLSVQQTPLRPQIKPMKKPPQNPKKYWSNKSRKEQEPQSSTPDITRFDDGSTTSKEYSLFLPRFCRLFGD
jgi:hypothetical protein